MNDNKGKLCANTAEGFSLIQAHFARIARRLQAEGEAAKSFDHGTNRGTIREAFIREFLSHNTSPLTGIGTGEIIHADSKPNERRNQIDVVIHSNRYPKVSLATGIDRFFAETVSSFIEIKSSLTKKHIRQSAQTAKRIKEKMRFAPQRFNPTGMVKNPRPYSLVFAYDGPSRIRTVFHWMKEVSDEDEYNLDELRNTSGGSRPYFNHLFIDGVFILGKGYVHLDALPFQSPLQTLTKDGKLVKTNPIWVYGEENELPYLWAIVNELGEKYLWNKFNLTEYLGVFPQALSD